MRSPLLLLLFSTALGGGVQAQGFALTYGGVRHQEAVALITDATGITAVVRDASRPDGPIQVRLLRTDLEGAAAQWHDVVLSGSYFVQAAVADTDGNIVLCGSCIRPGRSDHDALLARVTATGTVLVAALTDTPDEEEQLLGLERTSDGGYIACGTWRGGADSDALLMRSNDQLQLQWAQHYGTAGEEVAYGVTANAGGYVAVGRTATFNGDGDTYILRTDADGTEQWWQSWGGIKEDALFDVATSGTDLIMAGHTDSYGDMTYLGRRFRNAYVMAMDSDGDTLWTRAFGDTLMDHAAHALAVAANGDLLLAGLRGASEPTVALVMRATASGELLWKRTYPGERTSELHDIRPLDDNGFLTGGRCFGPLSGQVFLLRKDAQGQ